MVYQTSLIFLYMTGFTVFCVSGRDRSIRNFQSEKRSAESRSQSFYQRRLDILGTETSAPSNYPLDILTKCEDVGAAKSEDVGYTSSSLKCSIGCTMVKLIPHIPQAPTMKDQQNVIIQKIEALFQKIRYRTNGVYNGIIQRNCLQSDVTNKMKWRCIIRICDEAYVEFQNSPGKSTGGESQTNKKDLIFPVFPVPMQLENASGRVLFEGKDIIGKRFTFTGKDEFVDFGKGKSSCCLDAADDHAHESFVGITLEACKSHCSKENCDFFEYSKNFTTGKTRKKGRLLETFDKSRPTESRKLSSAAESRKLSMPNIVAESRKLSMPNILTGLCVLYRGQCKDTLLVSSVTHSRMCWQSLSDSFSDTGLVAVENPNQIISPQELELQGKEVKRVYPDTTTLSQNLSISLYNFYSSYSEIVLGAMCESNSDCSESNVCRNGRCQETCISSKECEHYPYRVCEFHFSAGLGAYNSRKCTHKSLLAPPHGLDIFAAILCFVLSGLALSAGVGGGGIYVPLLILVLKFRPHKATAVSQAMLAGGATSVLVYNYNQRHPKYYEEPLIDLDLVTILGFPLLAGVQWGSLLHKLAPDWFILFLLTVVLTISGKRTLRKGLSLWKEESRAIKGWRKEEGNSEENGDPNYDNAKRQDSSRQDSIRQDRLDDNASHASHASQENLMREMGKLNIEKFNIEKPTAVTAKPSSERHSPLSPTDGNELLGGSSGNMADKSNSRSSITRSNARSSHATSTTVGPGDTAILGGSTHVQSPENFNELELASLDRTSGQTSLVDQQSQTNNIGKEGLPVREISNDTILTHASVAHSLSTLHGSVNSMAANVSSGYNTTKNSEDQYNLNIIGTSNRNLIGNDVNDININDENNVLAILNQAPQVGGSKGRKIATLAGVWILMLFVSATKTNYSPCTGWYWLIMLSATAVLLRGCMKHAYLMVYEYQRRTHLMKVTSAQETPPRTPELSNRTTPNVIGKEMIQMNPSDGNNGVGSTGMGNEKSLEKTASMKGNTQGKSPKNSDHVLENTDKMNGVNKDGTKKSTNVDTKESSIIAKKEAPAKKEALESWQFFRSKVQALRLVWFGFGAGIVAALCGIGGGMLLGPIMLEMGLRPQVTSATTATTLFMLSTTASIIFVFSGQAPLEYAISFGIVTMFGAVLGKKVITGLVKRYNRASVIALLLAGITIVSVVMLFFIGITNLIQDLRSAFILGNKKAAANLWFKNPCVEH